MKKCKIDMLGRMVIPMHYRKELGISENSILNVECMNGRIIITPSKRKCCLCGADVDINFEIPLCKNCIEKIKEEK